MEAINLIRRHPCFSALRYVLRAAAKENTRYAMCGVNIEPGILVATDKKRLHYAENDHPFESGFYEIAKNAASGVVLIPMPDVNFPKWREIIPKHKNYFTTEILAGVFKGLGKHNIAMEPDFLSDAILNFEEVEVYYGKPEQAVLIKHEYAKYRAVIMAVNAVIEEREVACEATA